MTQVRPLLATLAPDQFVPLVCDSIRYILVVFEVVYYLQLFSLCFHIPRRLFQTSKQKNIPWRVKVCQLCAAITGLWAAIFVLIRNKGAWPPGEQRLIKKNILFFFVRVDYKESGNIFKYGVIVFLSSFHNGLVAHERSIIYIYIFLNYYDDWLFISVAIQ